MWARYIIVRFEFHVIEPPIKKREKGTGEDRRRGDLKPNHESTYKRICDCQRWQLCFKLRDRREFHVFSEIDGQHQHYDNMEGSE
jgi:hypothetical protein